MAVQIKVDIKGLDRLQSLLQDFPRVVVPKLRDASMKSAFTVEREAKILSPVDTGRLRASIATSLGILDQGLTSIVSTNVEYAIYVHEGTRRMRGRPFMKQAAEGSIPKIQAFYNDAIQEAISATI